MRSVNEIEEWRFRGRITIEMNVVNVSNEVINEYRMNTEYRMNETEW